MTPLLKRPREETDYISNVASQLEDMQFLHCIDTVQWTGSTAISRRFSLWWTSARVAHALMC